LNGCPSLESNPKKLAILIARQQGGLGDILMLTPTIRAIKEQNPNIPIVMSTSGQYGNNVLVEVLKNNSYIDKIISVKDLIDYDFQKVYNFGTSQEVFIESDSKHSTGNRIDIFAEMAGIELKDKQTVYAITDEEKEWAKKWIIEAIPSERRKLIGIQAHSLATKRNWPEEKLQLLSFLIVNTWYDASVLLFCESLEGINFKNYPNIYIISGFPIRQVAALMNECEVFVAPDSGLLHLAGALQKKTVAIMGSIRPESRIAYYPNAREVYQYYGCSPCFYERCFRGFSCMREIPVESVLDRVSSFLDGKLEDKKEICVVREEGVGDLIMLSSALKTMKDLNPDTNITLATVPTLIGVFKGLDFLKDVIPIADVHKFSFDKVIDLRRKVESPEVGGTLDTYTYKTANRIDVFEMLLGISSKSTKKYPSVIVKEELVEKMKSRIKYTAKKKWLCFQPTCTSNTRTLPPEYIPEILELLSKIKDLKVILVGKTEFWHGQRPLVDLRDIEMKNVINLMDRINVEELVALVSLTDYVLAPDSAAVHIAAALGKKCLALFGNMDPYTRIYYYPTVKVLYPEGELKCVPCHDFQNPCKLTKQIGGECMRRLTPGRIFREMVNWFGLF